MCIILVAISVHGLSNTIWLEEGSKVYTEIYGELHEVYLLDVSKDGELCGFEVDGNPVWIELKQTRTINDVLISVREIVVVHEQLKDNDVCKVIIGGGITEIVSDKDLVLESILEVTPDSGNNASIASADNITDDTITKNDTSPDNRSGEAKNAHTDVNASDKYDFPEGQQAGLQHGLDKEKKGFLNTILSWLKAIIQ
ncbi:hypothetical protein GF345_02635 [Candidatus Woesearchaeota archaeon]|nr:hypothetical protein [Candidatus Woesearchaeota archaeon]